MQESTWQACLRVATAPAKNDCIAAAHLLVCSVHDVQGALCQRSVRWVASKSAHSGKLLQHLRTRQ